MIVRGNLFVNFNSSCVNIDGNTSRRSLPAENALVSGNIFDMTAVGDEPLPRTAIDVSASHATVADNQVYVRGTCDPLLTGIRLRDDALNFDVHDNLLRNCGTGIATGRVSGTVGEVLDAVTFLRREGSNSPPLARRKSHCYRGWTMVWLKRGKPDGTSVIDHFDAETCRFTLRELRTMTRGDAFELFPPGGANWNLHDNTITDCLQPVLLDSYGSATSLLKNNLVLRGTTRGVKQAVAVGGRFALVGNHFFGFDEPGSAALRLYPDRFGSPLQNLYRDNIFDHCANVLAEGSEKLWDAAGTTGNIFLSCGRVPGASENPRQPRR